MNLVYNTEAWHFFDHAVRVMINFYSFHDVRRSLLRNLIFNTLRCMPEEFIFYALYGDVDPVPVLVFRIASVWTLTIFVQYFTSRRAARRNPNQWTFLVVFYFSSYGIRITQQFSMCELTHDGDFSRMVFLACTYPIPLFLADLVEDFIFADLNCWGNPWHKFYNLTPLIAMIAGAYTL